MSRTELLEGLDDRLQRLLVRASRRIPSPWGLDSLAPLRAALAEELYGRRRDEVERAHALFAGDGDGLGSAGAQAVSAVAQALVGELRAGLVGRVAREAARGGGTARPLGLGRGLGVRLAAELDERMPTDRMEHIDDPSFDEGRRTRAIRSFDRLNRALGSYAGFLDALEPLLDGGDRPTTVLDLASGHGGFPLALARLARARGKRLRIIASDLRPEYVEIGRRRAAARGESGVEFRVVDAFRIGQSFAEGEIDVITCTQTLHHFGAGPVAALVGATLRHARRGILFIDAARAASRLLLIGAATLLGSRDRAFFDDGTTSIRKAFVPEELRLIARCAPGGERLDAFYLPPGFSVLRSPVAELR